MWNGKGWCRAEKGNMFILTEKGKKECASYRSLTINKPVDEYEDEAPLWAVEKGYVEEVKNPDWIVKDGYKVVYYHKGYELYVGNPRIFYNKELAERYAKGYKEKFKWFTDEIHIVKTEYEGKKLKPCGDYNGKRVWNLDYWDYTGAIVGDLVEFDVVSNMLDALPPISMNNNCLQCGEPFGIRLDNGKPRNTYVTFKRICENIYEYCGNCFAGENTERGEDI